MWDQVRDGMSDVPAGDYQSLLRPHLRPVKSKDEHMSLWASSCGYFLAKEVMRQCIYGTSCKITIFEELCVPSAGPPPKTSSGIPTGQDVSEKWRHGVTHTLVSVCGFVLIRVRTIFGWLEAGKLGRADVHWVCQEHVWRAFHAKLSLLVLDLCNPIKHVACTLNHKGYKVL